MPTAQDLQVWIGPGTKTTLDSTQPANVWLPDPVKPPEVYVPGYWGILMQNNTPPPGS